MGIRVSVLQKRVAYFPLMCGTQNRMVHLQNLCPSFIYCLTCCSYVTLSYSHTRHSKRGLAVTIRLFPGTLITLTLLVLPTLPWHVQDAAIVFLLSDSGEGYITVDDNAGDRCASLSAGFSLNPNKIVPVAQEKSHGMAKW